MNMPFRCDSCGKINLQDAEALEVRSITRVVFAEGFVCKHCEKWSHVFLYTVSLLESLARLPKPGHKKFHYKLLKLVKKSEGLWSKVKRGKSTDKDMASPR